MVTEAAGPEHMEGEPCLSPEVNTLWKRVRPWLTAPIFTVAFALLFMVHLLLLPKRESGVGQLVHAAVSAVGFGPARATQRGGWSDCVLSMDANGRWQASEGIDVPPGGFLVNFKVSEYQWGVFAPTSFVTSRTLFVWDATYTSAALPPAAIPVARAWIDADVGGGPAFDQVMAGTSVTSRPRVAGWVQNSVLAGQFAALGLCAFAWATHPRPRPGGLTEWCHACGYSTLGLLCNQCPECGEELWTVRTGPVRPRPRP